MGDFIDVRRRPPIPPAPGAVAARVASEKSAATQAAPEVVAPADAARVADAQDAPPVLVPRNAPGIAPNALKQLLLDAATDDERLGIIAAHEPELFAREAIARVIAETMSARPDLALTALHATYQKNGDGSNMPRDLFTGLLRALPEPVRPRVLAAFAPIFEPTVANAAAVRPAFDTTLFSTDGVAQLFVKDPIQTPSELGSLLQLWNGAGRLAAFGTLGTMSVLSPTDLVEVARTSLEPKLLGRAQTLATRQGIAGADEHDHVWFQATRLSFGDRMHALMQGAKAALSKAMLEPTLFKGTRFRVPAMFPITLGALGTAVWAADRFGLATVDTSRAADVVLHLTHLPSTYALNSTVQCGFLALAAGALIATIGGVSQAFGKRMVRLA